MSQKCPPIDFEQLFTNTSTELSHQAQLSNLTNWTNGLLSVFLVSICSVAGAFILPLFKNKKTTFNLTMLFLMSLAVSALSGAALMVLLPEGLELDQYRQFDRRNLSACLGMFSFFLIARILDIAMKKDDKCCKNKSISEMNNVMALDHGPVCAKSRTFLMMDSDSDSSKHLTDKQQLAKESQKISDIKTVGWLVLIGDAAHNFLDGLALGTAFMQSVSAGWKISIAIFAEEFPHELGDYAILIKSGMSPMRAVLCNLLSACTCLIGFFVGAFFGESWFGKKLFSWMAGVFLYISLGNMLPEVEASLKEFREQNTRWAPIFVSLAGLATGYAIIYNCLDVEFDNLF